MSPSGTNAHRTLLLVDDELALLKAIRREFMGSGYNILTATSGEEALCLLDRTDAQVILSDYRMTGMTGVEFLRKALMLRPDAVRMVLSGYADLDAVTDAVNRGAVYKFLTKPIKPEQLQEVVREAFTQHDLLRKNSEYSRVFENTSQGIFVAGLDGFIESVNPAFCRMLGFEAADLIGMHYSLLHAELPGHESSEEISAASQDQAQWEGEIWLRRRSGEVFPGTLNLSVLRDANGRLLQVVGLCSDQTAIIHRVIKLHNWESRERPSWIGPLQWVMGRRCRLVSTASMTLSKSGNT